MLKSDLARIELNSGWFFDWSKEFTSSDREVFKLQVIGSDEIQGLVSLTIDQGFVLVHLVESSPVNKGSDTKTFSGVGAHLFAIACKIRFESECEGFVAFVSKSNLVSHYEQAIGAQRIGNGLLMEINPNRSSFS